MDVSNILSEIDAEIARLQQARAALAAINGDTVAAPAKRRGRPKGSTNAPKVTAKAAKKKRVLSPEGRKRIQEAMKRRWANRKKA